MVTHTLREVIIIDDDDEPSFHMLLGNSSAGGPSVTARTGAQSSSPHRGQPGCALRPLTACESFRVTRGKGEAGMRVTEVEDDGDTGSDMMLC